MKKLLALSLVLCLIFTAGANVASATPEDDLEVLSEVLGLIEERFLGEVDRDQLIAGALSGILQSLGDPYSEYFSPEEYEMFMLQVTSEWAGIGVVVQLTEEGRWQVQSVLPGGPADRAGLLPGDFLLQADGQPLTELTLLQLQQLLIGAVNSFVALQIERDGELHDLILQRALIEQPTLEATLLPGGIGYVHIGSFGENTAGELRRALQALYADGMRALLVDLRDNPGGLLQSVRDVAAELLPSGTVLRLIDRDGDQANITVQGPGLGLPMAALVNRWSASAAEVLAGAIRDRAQGLLIGERTYGKGVVQDIYELGPAARYGALKLTTAEFFTPNGTMIQSVGLVPDITISPDVDDLPLLSAEGTLYPGVQGEAVAELQLALSRLEFYQGEVHGDYDQATQEAVIRAQRWHGDPLSDGICDSWTQMVVNDLLVQQALEQANQQMLEAARSWLMGEVLVEQLGLSRWIAARSVERR